MPGAGGQPPQRTTFRPPWVKDGPSPLPMPSAPWALNSRRDSKPKVEEPPPFTQVTLKVSFFFFSYLISCSWQNFLIVYLTIFRRDDAITIARWNTIWIYLYIIDLYFRYSFTFIWYKFTFILFSIMSKDTNSLSDPMRTCSTRNIEGCLCSLFPFRY